MTNRENLKNLSLGFIFTFFFLVFPLSGCIASPNNDLIESPKKIQTTEELLAALNEGFEDGALGEKEFYRKKIGYDFAKFPINYADPKEFSSAFDEAVLMNSGDFSGRQILMKKWIGMRGERIIKIEFDAPGCLKKWEVERIFLKLFNPVSESAVFGVRPENWPVTYKISKSHGSGEQIIYLFIGEHDGCLLGVAASEIYK